MQASTAPALDENVPTERTIKFYEAMREALSEEMASDDRVFLLGESIRAGTYPYTKGLSAKFGDERVFDTPISEAGIAGCAFGAALEGMRPVVDFMYAGFAYLAASEIFFQMSQYHFLHGSKHPVPLTMIATCGVGKRVGNEHAVLPHATLIHHPGMKVCTPSTPYDAKGLLKAAIRDPNPVFFLWHTNLLTLKGHVPTHDYIVPLGKSAVVRPGSDVTVLASGWQTHNCLAVAEKLEGNVSVEVVDVRSYEPFDLDCLLTSIQKTTRLVVVDEGFERAGFAAEVIALAIEKGYDLLDAPPQRVCHPNVPIPGGYIDIYTTPTIERIESAIRRTLS